MKKFVLTVVFAIVAAFSAFFTGCGQRDDIVVCMPDGAPALALAKLMHEDTENDGVAYKVVSADLIASRVTNTDTTKNADVCVLPLNAASKLLGLGESYKMLGAVTHGNLYLLAKEGAYTAENLSSLVGKTVGVVQIAAVPGLTFKAVLNKYGIAWQEVGNDGKKATDKVNLLAMTGADAVGTTDQDGVPLADCYIVAEPAATAQATRKGYVIAGDIQALYGGEDGYPQAVMVAKNGLIEERGEWLQEFTGKVAAASDWLSTASGESIVSAVNAHMDDRDAVSSLKVPLLSAAALSRCGIRFVYAADCKAAAKGFLTTLIGVNDKAAAMPVEGFFWEYSK